MKYSALVISLFFTINAFAAPDDFQPDDTFRTIDQILYDNVADTPCATAAFANALVKNANQISETDDEQTVQQWIQTTFAQADVLQAVLACPEIQNIADDEHIRLQPIKYTFPHGREITINYATQPKILQQRIDIATKRNTDSLNTPSPRIGAIDDNSVWTNTDPAWYAIMVTEHGALDKFVGPDKNNTISLQYIYDNVDSLYPKNSSCTDKSAFARDKKPINRAVVKTVGLKDATGEDDTNDYYVAGDVSLRWVSYAEIALDVVITVATAGGGTVIAGVTKSARATRAMRGLKEIITAPSRIKTLERLKKYKKLEQELRQIDRVRDAAKYAEKTNEMESVLHELREIDKLSDTSKFSKEIETLEKATKKAVQDYIIQETKFTRTETAIARIKKYQTLEKELSKINRVKNPAKYAEKAKELETVSHELRDIEKLGDASKYADDLKRLEKESETLSKEMKQAIKADKDVEKYADARKAFSELQEYRRSYKNFSTALKKRKLTGNVLTRALPTIRATAKGNKAIKHGAKIARQSMTSGRVRDWLFQSTMRNIGTLGRAEAKLGILYSAIKIAGDMYDWAETSTGDFTNGVDFKPLLLLSADDLQGQENVVNYGMWLLWYGSSTAPEDDDAAYLQAMDFAEKFHTDLIETMDDNGAHPCNVDIYVVRPVLRNPNNHPELYYLIMNDTPWTTVE